MKLLLHIGLFSCIIGLGPAYAQGVQDTLRAYDALKSGKVYLDSLHYDSAIVYLNDAAAIYSRLARQHGDTTLWIRYLTAQTGVAESLRGMGKFDQAITTLSSALKQSEHNIGSQPFRLAKPYLILGKTFMQQGNSDKGLSFLDRSKELLENKGKSHYLELGEVYTELGITHWKKGDRSLGAAYLQKALDVRREILGDNDSRLSKNYTNLAVVFWEEADYAKAIWHLKESICLFAYKHGSEHPQLGSSYNNLGSIYEELGEFDQALHYAQKALNVRLKVMNRETPSVAASLANIGHIHRSMGQYEKASTYYQEALEIRQKTLPETHPNIGDSYAHQASIFSRKGDYDQALTYFEKALQIRLAALGEMHPFVAETYNAIGAVYWYKGDYQKTLDYYHKVLTFREAYHKGQPHPRLAGIYNNLGIVYWRKGDFDNAVSHYKKALDIHLAIFGETHPAIAENCLNLGLVYLNQTEEELPQAMEYFQRTLQIEQKIFSPHHPHLVNAYNHIGQTYALLHKPDSALLAFQEALEANVPGYRSEGTEDVPDLDEKVLDDLRMLRTLQTLAETQADRKDGNPKHWKSADRFFDHCLKWVDLMSQGYYQEGSQIDLMDRTWYIYEQAIANSVRLFEQVGDSAFLERAFYYAGKGKAMLLNQALRAPEARQFARIPDELVQAERSLKKQLNDYRQQWKSALLDQHADSLARVDLQNNLFRLQTSNDSIREVLEKQYPEYYQLLYRADPPPLADLQAYLSIRNSAAMSFFWGEDQLYIYTVTPSVIRVRARPLDSSLLQPLIDLNHIVSNSQDVLNETVYSQQFQQFQQYSLQLYAELMEPEADLIHEQSSLIIIPDGKLDYLPFELLLTDTTETSVSYKNLPFLLRNYVIQYAFSAHSLLQHTPENIGSRLSYAGFAPSYDLPDSVSIASRSRNRFEHLTHNRLEVEEVSRLMKGQRYLGKQATKETFQQDVRRQEILHLAMHAFVDDDNPLASGLVFASEDTLSDMDQRILRAYEIYAMEMSSDLVVLSACQTAIGKQVRGEGMMSLARAFRYAGCPSIVTSLWQADDPTTQKLMVRFFEHLKMGKSKAEALQEAKLEFLQQASLAESHPFHWATFVLIGDGDPVSSGSPFPAWWKIGLGLLLLIGIVALLKRYVLP